MITAIAIDDEPKALEIIKFHAARIPDLGIAATFTSPIEALAYLKTHTVDLVFLDINMKELSGMDMAKLLDTEYSIIFTTAYSEFALESYSVNTIDYLLKPFDFTRFYTAIQKFRNRTELHSPGREEFFFVDSGSKKVKIITSDIRYIEAEGNYTAYITSSGKVLERTTITSVYERLPARQFVRIHRSTIAAISHIDRIEDNHVIIGSQRLPIGASYKEELNNRIKNSK